MSANLDPDLLRTFTTIADTGSFTSAAQAIHKTQSAVSMQMKRLEDQLEKPLFKKQGRSAVMTAEGRSLLSYARKILALQEEAIASITEPDVTGTVRVGMPDDYVVALMPDLLQRFAERFPRVSMEVMVNTSSQLKKAMRARDLDLAIVTHRDFEGDGISQRGWDEQLVKEEKVCWAVSKERHPHKLPLLPLALFEAPCLFRSTAIETLEEIERPYRIAYQSLSVMGLIAAVKAGLAVAPLAACSMTEDMRILTPEEGFPALPNAQLALISALKSNSHAGARLARYIVDTFRLNQEMDAA